MNTTENKNEMTSQKIKEAFNREMVLLQKIYNKFPWQNREAYARWLAQTYHFVCHSTRLLSLSAARFSLSQNKFHLRCLDHMKEERSHEILALNDLKHLGYPISQFPESSMTSAFYQSQYYLIDYAHPLALYGYILCLEGISSTAGKDVYGQVCKAFGEKTATFWKVHSQEDDGHLAEAFEKLSMAAPTEADIILQSLKQSSDLYRMILAEIISQVSDINAFSRSEEDLQSYGRSLPA
ncbi:MAG: iron-containing redox enzyme family protein [Deltaproteobacteria bacterium]|nr:iron-containing redox enzyme family protein [Deltaproteobacteria bacterium]